MANYGSQAMWGDLQRVLVRPPLPADANHVERYGWRGVPDAAAAAAEHEELRALLAAAGAEVIVSEHDPGNPDAIYVYDPVLVGDDGAALLRPGKEGRLGEPDGIGASLEAAGVPVASRMTAPATVEGGDTVWLDHDTLLVGHGYRTGTAGIAALREAFPDAEVIAFDLPHWVGAAEVMHLMSLISPLDGDLAVVYPRIAPVRLMELLAERGIETVEVPDEEFETMGSNVLALGPRRALALEGNDETRRRMERAGVEVVTYKGDHISRLGDGGPTCLTRPLLRATAERRRYCLVQGQLPVLRQPGDADADEPERARPVAQAAVEQPARELGDPLGLVDRRGERRRAAPDREVRVAELGRHRARRELPLARARTRRRRPCARSPRRGAAGRRCRARTSPRPRARRARSRARGRADRCRSARSRSRGPIVPGRTTRSSASASAARSPTVFTPAAARRCLRLRADARQRADGKRRQEARLLSRAARR